MMTQQGMMAMKLVVLNHTLTILSFSLLWIHFQMGESGSVYSKSAVHAPHPPSC
jgi:hypothetical protein